MLKAQVIGYLGNNCTVNHLTNGRSVINFQIAHSEKYKDSQGVQHEKTTWVHCSYFTDRDPSNVAKYLSRGKQVFVEGIPEAKAYSRNDGTPAASLSIRVRELKLLGGAEKAQDPAPVSNTANSQLTGEEEDAPF